MLAFILETKGTYIVRVVNSELKKVINIYNI